MLVVDAGCVFEVVARRQREATIRQRFEDDQDVVAPYVIDIEVLGVIRRHHLNGRLDGTAAAVAVAELREWPAWRFPHAPLLDRAWELRDSLPAADAIYVALAESLDATLLTTDRRLADAPGPTCPIEVITAD